MIDHAYDELHGRYESVFCIFMAAAAFLWRGIGGESDPALLGLFGLLLGVNLAATRALKRWPGTPVVSAAIALINCAAVSAIVARLGGADTQFWVLYLLPIYSSCILLGRRETALITAGAVSLTVAGSMPDGGVWGPEDALGAGIKVAVLLLASALTLRLAQRERDAARRLEEGRARARELELHVRAQCRAAGGSSGPADEGLLAAAAAHDLGNTLSVVLGFAEIALENERTPVSVRSDLESIRRSAMIAQKTASALLGLSRRTPCEPSPMDVHEAIRDIVGLLRLSMHEARVTAEIDLQPEAARVCARPNELQRLLLNLASNAIRAMKDHGGGSLRVSTRAERGAIVVRVEDTGPGLPEAVLVRLFQPYVEGGDARGHGLGLYICSEIARENGGRLHGENLPAGGARFSLFLPEPALAGMAASFRTDVVPPFGRVF